MGDRITYGDQPGEVEFIVRDASGDSEMDWYLTLSPHGGFMLNVEGIGNVFVHEPDEDLILITREESFERS